MKAYLKVSVLALIVAIFAFQSATARASDHPAYLHALQDLRDARAHLDRLTPSDHVDDMEQHAIREIDAAINEIKGASIDDGKDLRDHPSIDAHMNRTDRYHRALELLDKAHKDVNRDEDNGYARGLQARALHHIDEAHHTVDNILHNVLQ